MPRRRLAVHDEHLQAAARTAGLDAEQLAGQIDRAARVVCAHAVDVDEATELLDMIGLLEEPTPPPTRTLEDLVDRMVADAAGEEIS